VSDEFNHAQTVVDGALAQTGTTVDQTLAETRGIVDQTLAQTDGIVDQALAETDAIVDQTLAETRAKVDGALAQSGVGGGGTQTGPTPDEATRADGASTAQPPAAADDRAVAPAEAAPPSSDGAPDLARGRADATPSVDRQDAIADPTSAAPPDVPADTTWLPDPAVTRPAPADALAAAPGPTADAVAPPPAPGAGSFLDQVLGNTTDPRLLTAAGLAFMAGAGGAATLRGAALADSRLIIQIGMALGFLYAMFISVWLWATRLRAPVPRPPIRR
jgi:hypothetical protein